MSNLLLAARKWVRSFGGEGFNGAIALRRGVLLVAVLLAQFPSLAVAQPIYVDVCVYGGTSGGVIAAVKAARMGKTVALVCDKNHIGGMTSGGLGWTDIGHVGTGYIQGMANEFYARINQKYGRNVNYEFEPHVAESVFNDMVNETSVTVYSNQYLVSVVKQGNKLIAATMNNGKIFRASQFIDASYTGDLMAAAGVAYTIGRESTNAYGESLAGVRPPDTSFGANVNPYVVSNNPSSGLLPLIQSNSLATLGSADSLVQTYNFRMCFTTVASNQLAFTPPTNYNVAQFELLARYLQANPSTTLSSLMTLSTPLPNSKMDINNSGPISTDFVGDSSAYSEASPAQRAQIWQEHKNYEQGFFYFLATDLRVPSAVRTAILTYGPAKDEFTDNGGWPWELYVRESRRMVSDYVMTQSNVFNLLNVPDSIGMAGYFTDSHYCQRILNGGVVINEGTARGDITVPYPVSYRALVPKTNECVNLLVPWSMSASHIAFCSLRMEPAFMIMSQAAATAACFAIDDGVAVQNVNMGKLQTQLQADNQLLYATGTSTNVVDDADTNGVTIVGSWVSSTATSGYYGSDYLHDNNTNKGLDSITFTPNLSQTRTYQVMARWTANANRATNVPYDIIYPGGTNTVFVDQTTQGGQWVLLMTTNFNVGTNGHVRIRNAGTSGYVIADAVEFVPYQETVTILATDPNAIRSNQSPGSVTVCRAGATDAPLTVTLNLTGTAVNGSDYQTIPGTVILPAGISFSNISVVPKTNANTIGSKTAVVGIASSANYTVGSPASATVTIHDTPINEWRVQYFGTNATNSAIAGDNACPANDGVPNLVKYALGLNPNLAATPPLISFGIDTNGLFALTYPRPDPPPTDLNYIVEKSDELMTWCTNAPCLFGPSVVFNTNGTATVTVESQTPPASAPKQFLRLSVTRN